jgi:hypothetical protein
MFKFLLSLGIQAVKSKFRKPKNINKMEIDIPDTHLKIITFENNNFLFNKEFTEYGWQLVSFAYDLNDHLNYKQFYFGNSDLTILNIIVAVEDFLNRKLTIAEIAKLNDGF